MAGREPQQGDVIAEKYRIDAPLGRGGMGMVLAATHVITQRRLAVKWMLPGMAEEAGAVQRFMREAKASARIDHPNVVRVYDVGQHEGSLFMVMELLQGEPLSAVLERGALDPAGCVSLMLPIARGVAAAHAEGIVHRDIKPDNLFLCRDGQGRLLEPKVLDFGISKLTEGVEPGSHTLTGTHTVLGTPYYMSKEQMTRSKGVDHRTDIYALGVVLYQMLTGQLPFDGDTYGALAVAVATEDPLPIQQLRPEVSAGLVAVVMKAMAREVEDRYATVGEFIAALAPFAGDAATDDPALAATQPVTSGAPSAPHLSIADTPMSAEVRATGTPTVPGQRRNGALIAGSAVVVLGAAAALLLWPAAPGEVLPEAAVAPAPLPPPPAPAEANAMPVPTPPPAPVAPAADKPDAGAPETGMASADKPAAKPRPTAKPKPREKPRPRATRRPRREPRQPAPTAAPPRAPAPAPAPTPKRKARAGDMSLDDFL